MNTTILDAAVSFIDQPLLTPLTISSGSITELSEAVAEVTVRVDGREATGKGAIYLSDMWAWPGSTLGHARCDAELRALCETIAANLPELCGGEPAHPVELGLRLHESICGTKDDPPVLARAMCTSPFDAAIHDAVGNALECSAFDLYTRPAPIPSADPFLNGHASDAIRNTLEWRHKELNAWYLVTKGDTAEDLDPWVRKRGYRCFKLKLFGKDNAYDVERTVEVYRILRELGAENILLSIDTNEANPDAASVVDYLERLNATNSDAYNALLYLEQPTARDIIEHPFDWREAAALKPVMLDEGLTSLEGMRTALDQGWSGFALKTCKGHSFTLVAAAWAIQHGLLLSVQDLTNPGIAMIHAALLAAHLPTLNGVELNSPQFTPAANEEWLPRLPGLFDVHDGVHKLPEVMPKGLGSET
ncbi:MAG: mandelate racemase/muconate lactonizing enzyme family protein [Candidatus Pacebacteria bacterium]|nr:mandelate racemase/muconate lactonizing enzyme family protein [Candidatus Paceibacterota bacterium]